MQLTSKTKKILTYVIVGVICLFAMNRCTVACNRDKKLSRYENTSVAQVDSLRNTISALISSCDSLNVVIGNLERDTLYLRKENRELTITNKELLEKATRQKDVHVHWDKQQ